MALTLPELVERGLMDAGWADVLAPVADDIARMGEWLRAEVAAGRPYLPA
ncbi:uracil-DNA glycosylase, partial [Clavibacter nebraskensis]